VLREWLDHTKSLLKFNHNCNQEVVEHFDILDFALLIRIITCLI
jgi:hypothetical protein